MIQKNRYLFKLIARNCENVFQKITEYMNGTYRRHMDEGNPLFLNKTPKQILGSLRVEIRTDADISDKYDEFILEWMADVYTYMQWKCEILSSKIEAKIKPEKLYSLYNPLHETSLENSIEKLKTIYKP